MYFASAIFLLCLFYKGSIFLTPTFIIEPIYYRAFKSKKGTHKSPLKKQYKTKLL